VPTVAPAARGPAADPRHAAAERALALLTALLAHVRLFSRASEAPLAPGVLGAQLSAAAVDARLEHIPYCTEVVRGAAAARALPPGDAPDAILARAGLALACLEEIARAEPPPAPPMQALAEARAALATAAERTLRQGAAAAPWATTAAMAAVEALGGALRLAPRDYGAPPNGRGALRALPTAVASAELGKAGAEQLSARQLSDARVTFMSLKLSCVTRTMCLPCDPRPGLAEEGSEKIADAVRLLTAGELSHS
jgi:hypothetical protein